MAFVSGPGSIVLAAYSPDRELLHRQLRSLRDQTVQDWECIISVDGDDRVVREVVAEVAQGDSRFRILADGVRRGFYLNFENGLKAISPTSTWVALCDQDDLWYPEKIASLLPHLHEVSLVSGLARIVTYPEGEDRGRTERRDRGPVATALINQYTGSLCVLRADLARLSLPFPRVASDAATHDHWIAVLAGATGGARIVETVLQDYVQHSNNVLGDPRHGEAAARRLPAIGAMVRTVIDLTRKTEGTVSPAAMLRMFFKVYVGWRQAIAVVLASRVPASTPGVAEITRLFGPSRRFAPTIALLRSARREGEITRRFAIEYVASWGAGMLIGGRRMLSRVVPSGGPRRTGTSG